ncbi:uncharacterized protein BYT42DRAFT_493789 [Radiomyces spectabilis]|uniref:uncharacterized protein n=1 Tax=Radiomyces spectabilis TaxID=64574 RepID=UPI0022206A58|nr:uncharacterized protein BYT42DRAFT_493789 [Radiomyces spectabilis]KAI8384825.1 hypothetical protein BYT42DRAFT_493789 [Radiomyces spectabilis]
MTGHHSLDSRIQSVVQSQPTELPEFPDDKSDLPSDYEYNPDEMDDVEEEVEEIDENELLAHLDRQEHPLYVAQRLFYNEVNTTQSQTHASEWQLHCLQPKVIEDLYAHGWATVKGMFELQDLKGAYEEANSMRGQFTPADKSIPEGDPFRDTKARDDAIIWLDPSSQKMTETPYLQKMLDFIRGPLSNDLKKMMRLRGPIEYQLSHFPSNGRYEKHRDGFPIDDPEDTQQRRVTVMIFLTPGWTPCDGGELRIFGNASEQHGTVDAAARDIHPLLDHIVIMLSGVVDHEILPAAKERFALTAWLR